MKRLLLLSVVLPLLLTSCGGKTNKEKELNTISFDTMQADCMAMIACHAARGDQSSLGKAIAAGLGCGLSENQIKEALSQLYAYCGFPRSLNALGTLQKVVRMFNEEGTTYVIGEEASPLPHSYNALSEGTRVQTKLTGKAFHYEYCPAEDYYLKAHLFGDIFARDVLSYAERELVTVSALSGLENVMPQLEAHVRGSRNMGVSDNQLEAVCETFFLHGLTAEGIRLKTAIGLADGKTTVVSPSAWPLGNPNDTYAQYFTGQSWLAPMEGGMANVTFEPGCRNNWHVHHGAVQVIVCVSGRGWYKEWGKEEIVELKPGVVVAVPEGVKHWHGAAKDSWMQHLTYHTDVKSGHSTEWLEAVSDEEYYKIN